MALSEIFWRIARIALEARDGIFESVTCVSDLIIVIPLYIYFQAAMASLNLENCLSIPDDYEGYSKNLFNIPKHYESCVGNVMIPAGMIQVKQDDSSA